MTHRYTCLTCKKPISEVHASWGGWRLRWGICPACTRKGLKELLDVK